MTSASASPRTSISHRLDPSIMVFSILAIIELIHAEYPHLTVSNEGEKDFIVKYLPNRNPSKISEIIKTTLLCIIIFFGSSFTIMAFNNDVSVTDVFAKLYLQVTGQKSSGVTELEICYSIGLALGILIFFNHVGRKKITPDPTPIQVEMRKYEKDTDTAFIENAERKGHCRDVS
jgi:stage V sporulation protein AA